MGKTSARAGDGPDDPRLLRLSPKDNIAALKAPVRKGERILIGGKSCPVEMTIATGHKIAVAPIAAGERIYKYGAPIGSATTEIAPGQYVHIHNMKSDYIPTYTIADQADRGGAV